jgi:hypothetical protein
VAGTTRPIPSTCCSRPLENLTLNASYYGFERREEARAAAWLNTGQGTGNCGPLQVGGNPSLYCGEYPVPASVATMEPRGFGRQADIDVFRVSAEWALSDALTLTYTFGNVDGETKTANTAEADTINCGTILGPPNGFPALCNFQGSACRIHRLRPARTAPDATTTAASWTGAVGVFYLDGLDQAYSVSINLAAGAPRPIDIQDES